MSNYITTHNAQGQAVFSRSVPLESHKISTHPSGDVERGSMEIVYATTSPKPDLSTEADIDGYSTIKTNGLPTGQICPDDGVSLGIITFGANEESPLHRTMTLDILLVLEGVVELHLDSGEMKTLQPGDTITQRGTMHKWVNKTPNGGKAKMVAVAQSIAQPLRINGARLEAKWHF